MSNNNTNSSNAPNPNPQHFLQNNGVGMPPQPQLGAGQNLMPPFMQPPMNAAPFMNAANHNHFPLHRPHMGHQQGQPHVVGGLGPQNSVVGNANYNNPMFPVQGQVMQNQAQLNLSPLQGQFLAQSILNMLQQPNMNMSMSMPNGQFCGPYPMQNMNQQLPMQMSNPPQGVPYGMHPSSRPVFRFPNQVPQAMVPQNSMFSTNPQLGFVPGNQVRPQIDPNEKILAPPNANANAFVSSSPFPSQQLQGNTSGSVNPNLAHTNNSQPPAFMKQVLKTEVFLSFQCVLAEFVILLHVDTIIQEAVANIFTANHINCCRKNLIAILKLMFQTLIGKDHLAKTSKINQIEGGFKQGMLFSSLLLLLVIWVNN